MTRRKHKEPNKPFAASHQPRPPVAALCTDRIRPWLLGGMTALCVARPLFPSESAAFFGDGLTMVMLWIVLAVFWLLGAIGRPKFSVRFGWTDAAVVLLIGWYVVASLYAVANASPRPAMNMLWEWLGMGLCYLLARQFIATAREARAVAAVMVALAVALSGYGLFQYCYEMPNTRAEYKTDPDRAMRNAGLWFPPGSRERELFESRLGNREPLATFALTNSLAAFLTTWLVMLIGMGFSARRNRKRLLGMGVCLIPIAICLLLTKSRSGYIASCVGLVLVWLLCREQPVRIGWKLPAAAMGIATLLLAAALAIDGPEVFGKAWYSLSFRMHYWQSTVHMIGDHPLVGCGPGNFQNTYTQYKLPQAWEEVADPHNFLLEICATAGTPAALAFLLVLGSFAYTTIATTARGLGTSVPSCIALNSLTSSNPQSPIPNPYLFSSPSSDASLHVLAGGAAGFLLSVPIGLLSTAPPGAAAVLLGLPLAAASVGLLWGWIRDGWLPRLLPAVGVAVLLVDLLATGGIGFPSVAGTLWLLLALGLEGERPHTIHAFAAWAAILAVIGLAVACYKTAYAPVLGCQVQLRMAEREPDRAVEHLAAAAAADPLSAEPWRQLAAIEFDTWWREPSADSFRRFEKANAQFLALAPNAAPAWLAAGDWYFRAYSKMDQNGKKAADDAIQKALNAYRRAVQLYPNSKPYRAKLAEACQVADDRPAFRPETP